MFCDTYDKVLNDYNYRIKGSYAEFYFGIQGFQCMSGTTPIPCTNNVCVLKYKDGTNYKTAITTSLNQEINAQTYSILEAFGGTRTNCDGKLNSTTFQSCGTGVWYNSQLNSIIYSKDSINIQQTKPENLFNYVQNIYNPVLNYVRYANPSPYDYSFITDTQDFKKIYLTKNGDKTISIITEEINNQKYMIIKYSKFETNICSLLNTYIQINPEIVPLDCIKDGTDTYVITGGLSQGYYDLLNDLGPKIIIK